MTAEAPPTDLLALLDGLLDPVFAVDRHWTYTFVNVQAAAIMGVTPQDLLGRELWTCFPEALDTDLNTEYRRVMATRQPRDFELHYPALDVWVQGRAFPYADGIAVHFRDTTASRLDRERREALLKVTMALADARSSDDAAQAALRLGLPALGATAGAVLLMQGQGAVLAHHQGYDGRVVEPWRSFIPLDAPLPAMVALRTREPVFLRERSLPDAGWHLSAGRDPRTRALAAIPLLAGQELVGVLTLSFATDRTFNDAEQDFIRSLGGQLAQALVRARAAQAHREALVALQRERTQLAAVLDQLPAAVWLADAHSGEILMGNAAIRDVLGLDAHPTTDATGQPIGYHPDGRPYALHEWPLSRTITTGEPVIGEEIQMPRADGRRVTVRFSSALIRDDRGEPSLAVVTGQDVTALADLMHGLRTRLQERVEALDAFVQFTTASGTATEPLELALLAERTLRATLGEVDVGYYECRDDRWRAQVCSDTIPEAVQVLMRAGFQRATPVFVEAEGADEAVFRDDWNGDAEGLPGTRAFGATGLHAIRVNGVPQAMLAITTTIRRSWSARERAVFAAVARSLTLALERAALGAQLQRQNAQLAARSRALEGFAELTRQLNVQARPDALAQRAADALLALLPDGCVVYFERDGGRWQRRAQAGDLPDAALGAAIAAGLPVDRTPSLTGPHEAGGAAYQDLYDPEMDHLAAEARAVRATAALPVRVNGAPAGVIFCALRAPRAWSAEDRTVMESIVRSLGLAIEGAEAARELRARQHEVENRNAILEAFARLAHDLAFETDPYTLVRRAQEILLDLLPDGQAVYLEPEGDHWAPHAWSGAQHTDGPPPGDLPADTPLLQAAWERRQPQYQDDPACGGAAPARVHTQVALPVLVNGAPQGVLLVGLFEARQWSATDRALLETTVQHLGMALERAVIAGEVARQRAELERANAELDAFAYSASHDLRTPVRHIEGFTRLLREALGPDLPGSAAKYLGVLDASGKRMGSLIDALLEFSRTSRSPLAPTSVNLAEVVAEVRAELAFDQADRHVTWRVGRLPTVRGDRALLRQVVGNLLGNALKYSRTRDEAVIKVSAERRDGAWWISVQDNGVGFDERYADKLFGVFQRLHRNEEFEGTGVGLATVRRIIQRHGGEVFARSVPDEGATFGFSLPSPRGAHAP